MDNTCFNYIFIPACTQSCTMCFFLVLASFVDAAVYTYIILQYNFTPVVLLFSFSREF